MFTTKRALTAVLGAVAFVSTACSEPLAPDALLGTYRATDLSGFVIVTPGMRYELIEVLVQVTEDRVLRTTRTLETDLETLGAVVREATQPMLYTIDGARLRTRQVPTVDAVLIPTPDYLVIGGGLREVGENALAASYERFEVVHRAASLD